jgi:shikimate kinase
LARREAYNQIMQNIVLTGFMGTGKTTIGRLLAQRLNLAFVDTDALIVARDGRAIPDIFRQDGEAAFRQLETAVAQELAAQSNLVIATGGGLLLDPQNVTALSGNGCIFCLVASPAEILRRVGAGSGRPLLQGPDPAATIRQLLADREVAYGRFTQIDTDNKSPEQIVKEIMKWVSTM